MKDQTIKVECVGKIEPALIPEYVALNVGEAIYKSLLADSRKPGFWEGFERWKAERAQAAM